MSAKYVRDMVRAWCTASTHANFFDTINIEQKPTDPVWFTAEFFATDNSDGTFCGEGYVENGAVDLVFFSDPGLGDGPILSAMEPALQEFLQQQDPAGKLIIESHDPIEEASKGSGDSYYRLVMGVNYTYAI